MTTKQPPKRPDDLTGKETISPENHGNVGQRQPSAAERPDVARDAKRAPERGKR